MFQNFFQNVIEFLGFFWDLISNVCKSSIVFLHTLVDMQAIVPVLTYFLPSFLLVSVTICIAVAVIKLVLSLLPF